MCPSPIRLTTAALLAITLAGATTQAGRSPNPYDGDAVVATVTGVSAHAATYANPPRVTLEVHEVLQGDPKTNRREAIWAPRPHDIDTGVIEDNPQYKAWAAKKMEGPAVGSRWILYGFSYSPHPAKPAIFHVSSEAAFPFSDEKLAAAKNAAIVWAEYHRKLNEEMEADRRADARLKAAWRTSTTRQDLEHFTAEADLVVTARWVSAASTADAIGVEITSVLKGQVRDHPDKAVRPAGGPRYIDFAAGPALQLLMDRQTEYLLFLSDAGVTFNHISPRYPRIRSGDGAVIANEEALRAVRDALQEGASR